MFLTKRAVCLLVCDAEKFSLRKGTSGGDKGLDEKEGLDQDEESEEGLDDDDDDDDGSQLDEDVEKLEELRVCEWLRCLSWRAPGCDVLLVATKCDKVTPKVLNVLPRRMEKACQCWIQEWTLNSTEIKIEKGVSLTSCAAQGASLNPFSTYSLQKRRLKQGWPCDMFTATHGNSTSLLRRITHKPGDSGCRGAAMIIPRGWDIALTAIDALSAGRDPIRCVRERLGGQATVHSSVCRNPLCCLRERQGLIDGPGRDDELGMTDATGGISMEKLIAEWMHLVDLLKNEDGVEIFNPDGALEGALCIREFEGRLLIQGSQVFLDVAWLAMMLKPVVCHNARILHDGAFYVCKVGERNIILRTKEEKILWGKLERESILDLRLARVLWPGGLHEQVLEILASLGITLKLPNDEHGGLVVVLRMGEFRPLSVDYDIDRFHCRHSASLTVEWEMPLGVPPGFMERVLVRCSSLGTVCTLWRFGVLVQRYLRDDNVAGTFALLLEYSKKPRRLVMEVYGNRETSVPWAALSYAMSAFQSMLTQFPGLPWR